MLFKRVESKRPYPDHGLTHRDWAEIPPRRIRISKLVTGYGFKGSEKAGIHHRGITAQTCLNNLNLLTIRIFEQVLI